MEEVNSRKRKLGKYAGDDDDEDQEGCKKKNIKSPTNVSSIEHLIQFVEIVELYSKLITSKLEVFQIFQVGFKIVLVVIFAGGSTTCPRIYG